MCREREQSDLGTTETQRKGNGIDLGYTPEGQRVGKLRGALHFDILFARGVIDHKQFTAGERLRDDAYSSGQFAHIKSSADFSVKGNVTEFMADRIAESGKRYRDAVSCLMGWEKLTIQIVVVDDGYMKNTSTSPAKQRRAVNYLRDGLDRLVKFYGV